MWRASQAVSDPTITRVLVATTDTRVAARLSATAHCDADFVSTWQALVGTPAPAPARAEPPAASAASATSSNGTGAP